MISAVCRKRSSLLSPFHKNVRELVAFLFVYSSIILENIKKVFIATSKKYLTICACDSAL